MAEILSFPPQTGLEEQIDLLMEAYRAGRMKNLVLGYTIREDNDKEFPNKYGTYWFGQNSCIYVLGLLRILNEKIIYYMKELNDRL